MPTADDIKNLVVPIATGSLSLEQLVAKIAGIFVTVAGILAFFYLIYAGILYITAGNNPDQAKKAQAGLINVIIGVIIISLSYLIIRTVGNIIVIITE